MRSAKQGNYLKKVLHSSPGSNFGQGTQAILSHRILTPLAASQVASFKNFLGLILPGINFPGLSFPGLSSPQLLTIYTHFMKFHVLPGRFLIACSRLSDSGVRREGREREKIKRKKRSEFPRSHPYPLLLLLLFFFRSNLFALFPRSARLEQAKFL